MMNIKKTFSGLLFITTMGLSQSALSVTLIGDQQGDLTAGKVSVTAFLDDDLIGKLLVEPGEIILLQPNIAVEGSLYLDFSVFSDYDFFAPSGIVSFESQRIIFYPATKTPEITNIANLNFYASVFESYETVGDALFFGNTPVMDATFSATENIYIGDYSALADNAVTTVPVPAAFWFFVSGLSVLLGGRLKKQL